MEEPSVNPESDIENLTLLGKALISMILEGEPMTSVKKLIEVGAPLWYQDEEEGCSALHAAAYTQDEELLKYLLEEGAVWNAGRSVLIDFRACTVGSSLSLSVDKLKHTAADIALSFNNARMYTLIRDHGLRKLLLGLLSSKSDPERSSHSLVLSNTDQTAAASTEIFLNSRLTFTTDEQGQEVCVVRAGDEEVGVMMTWERGIMEETVKLLCEGHPNSRALRVLNIGHGLGVIDDIFQGLPTPPALHCIVEPHSDVLRRMKGRGWYDKPGVKILEGKWQDSIDALNALCGFDVVYTDTFSEDYSQLREFFELLPDLLSGPESRFSFFNGLGATNLLFYDVYTHLSELHLADVGVDVQWHDVYVDEGDDRWGATRQYFALPVYRLPVGSMGNFA
ncbi:Arginine N-methyltransferase 2 [Marasmius crinis-equi]|uniref:Arginine N-methyltransferase 2 n=1 Tax=Marasmius crinis-equi TaxID=585013 RepID=A0ABR3FPG9_9AGAR